MVTPNALSNKSHTVCPVCKKKLESFSVDSVSIYEWDAENQENIVIQMYCSYEELAAYFRR
jgi:hypothetical protein